jgi:hypothetical protein
MSAYYLAWPTALGLLVGIVALIETGRRIGRRRLAKDEEGARAGLGAVEGAIYGLLGLLLAFTFSGAASRLDTRRQLILEEANAIGTAWLRIDVLPAENQWALRDLFRRYVDSRLETYRRLPDIRAAQEELKNSVHLQNEIWKRSVAACETEAGRPYAVLVLGALNEMIDITTTRVGSLYTHPPMIVYVMLLVLTLVTALLAGYGMAGGKRRSWLHIVGFALIMATTVYVIVDVEFPRTGFFRVNDFDRFLMDVRASMNG